MRYLFHNVYGDADELIASKPNDVVCIPFGWTAEIEEERNKKINELNVVVSGLPSLCYLEDNQYKEFRIDMLNKPWSWESIESAIAQTKNIIVVTQNPTPSVNVTIVN